MALLDNPQLTRILQKCEREFSATAIPIDYVKPEFVDGVQAVEDWFDLPATISSRSAAIETAAPGVFSNTQKKKMVKFWLDEKSKRE